MVRRRAQRPRRTNTESLKHVASAVLSTGGSTDVTGAAFNIIANRPAKPRWLEIQHFSSGPRTFTVLIRAGNGEEVARSGLILSGPIPKKTRVSIPVSTDFGMYTGAEPLLTFNHASAPGINAARTSNLHAWKASSRTGIRRSYSEGRFHCNGNYGLVGNDDSAPIS